MKKKAIKIATASAIAASAFVAAAPAQTDAASNVEIEVSKAVTQMKKAYHTYSDVTANGVFADINVVYKEYNAAKAAYSNAKAVVKAAGGSAQAAYEAQLDVTYNDYIAKRVVTYIDAYNYATTLDGMRQDLEAALVAKDWNQAEELYHAISYELKTRTVILHRVYGETARGLLVDEFKLVAQDLRDSIQNEVSVKMYFDKANDLVAAGNLTEAKAAMDKVADLVAGLDKDTNFGADLLTKVATVKAAYEAKLTPAVESVSAINATQIEVKFNLPISKASLYADGVSGSFHADADITIQSLDGVTASVTGGTLSADGKTLTLTANAPVSKRYDVLVDGLKTTSGKTVAKYQQVVTFAVDTTAPTILGTERINASQVKVKFSEPLQAFSPTFKYADGSAVTVTGSVAAGASEVIFTIDPLTTANKEIVATFIGAQDQAGNLLTPNPATVSFTKGAADGVAPVVSSITQVGPTKFEVKVSEALASNPTVTVDGAATIVAKDATDATKYVVTAESVLDGAQTVVVSGLTDLSGVSGTAYTKVVVFTKDIATPKVASSVVVQDATNKKEYLEITFDRDVALNTATVTGDATYMKDFVTSTTTLTGNVSYKDATATNKKVVRVELDSYLGTTTDVEGAKYTVGLDFTGVTSLSGIAADDTATATFTRGKDGVPASTAKLAAPSVTAVANDNNKVKVTFPAAVDGASATNVNNYRVDGAIVESVTLEAVSGGTQVAYLNLKANSNTFTGTRNIIVENVKALGSSVTMDRYVENTVELKENIAPTVTKAVLTSTGTVQLTFSEGVTNAVADVNDFELYIGGLKVADKNVFSTAELVTSGTNVVITLKADDAMTNATVNATDISKGLALKALSTLDITDGAGNKITVPSTGIVIQ